MDRMQQNRSNAAIINKAVLSLFIKQVLNKIIQFLPCHVLVLSFGRILNHIEDFIEQRCSFYSLSMDAPCFCNLLGPLSARYY